MIIIGIIQKLRHAPRGINHSMTRGGVDQCVCHVRHLNSTAAVLGVLVYSVNVDVGQLLSPCDSCRHVSSSHRHVWQYLVTVCRQPTECESETTVWQQGPCYEYALRFKNGSNLHIFISPGSVGTQVKCGGKWKHLFKQMYAYFRNISTKNYYNQTVFDQATADERRECF